MSLMIIVYMFQHLFATIGTVCRIHFTCSFGQSGRLNFRHAQHGGQMRILLTQSRVRPTFFIKLQFPVLIFYHWVYVTRSTARTGFMLKLYGFQLKNKRVELTWMYVDAKCVPAATLRRRLNSNRWGALCDLNWDRIGSILSVMGTVSWIGQSYVNRHG